jgi:hypothetical protein
MDRRPPRYPWQEPWTDENRTTFWFFLESRCFGGHHHEYSKRIFFSARMYIICLPILLTHRYSQERFSADRAGCSAEKRPEQGYAFHHQKFFSYAVGNDDGSTSFLRVVGTTTMRQINHVLNLLSRIFWASTKKSMRAS